ncbi:hypothetical protein ACSSS7_004853 [Eimeria intestinalis]
MSSYAGEEGGGGPPHHPPHPAALGGAHRDTVIKEGWLSKQSKFLKDWRRRWFVLTPQCLCSYKTSDVRSQKPTEVLYLRDCSTVKSADDELNKENAFRVDTPNRVFYLLAENTQDKESWIGHIGRQMYPPAAVAAVAAAVAVAVVAGRGGGGGSSWWGEAREEKPHFSWVQPSPAAAALPSTHIPDVAAIAAAALKTHSRCSPLQQQKQQRQQQQQQQEGGRIALRPPQRCDGRGRHFPGCSVCLLAAAAQQQHCPLAVETAAAPAQQQHLLVLLHQLVQQPVLLLLPTPRRLSLQQTACLRAR